MIHKPQPKILESISVKDFYEKFKDLLKLSLVAGGDGLERRISENFVNRPSLTLIGCFKDFGYKRIQLFGAGDMSYLNSVKSAKQYEIIKKIARRKIPCIVISHNTPPTKAMLIVAQEDVIPLFRSTLGSREFVNTATLILEELFAPRITEHGTLMDVHNIGALLRGESGVGKSECALALIDRGHSLVADDMVYIRLVKERELAGTSSDLNRGYMECRGLGIINIGELFGISAVRVEKRIDLVVTFEFWQPGMEEERTGLEEDYYEILGVKVQHIRLPVRPGRDLARLVEVAAMVRAQKLMGRDSAKEFNERLIAHMTREK